MSGLWSAIIGSVGALLAAEERNVASATRAHDIEMQHSIIQLYEEEPPPSAAADPSLDLDEILQDFVAIYDEFMREHYRRAPRYTTDLFCSMVSISMLVTCEPSNVQTLHRYWWLPITHPVTRLLMAHNVSNFGTVEAGVCGTCVIYPDQFVMDWIERIVVMFRDAGVPLEPLPAPPPPLPANSAPEPPVATASSTSVAVNTTTSKKSD